ncbi:hypothetical protein [Mucilaginibacter ginkgonis]|uniref:Lipoprotein n=1 Tax=Mucilaginibacter ginkgonis TaxID=2682091 RepID=A0A6I4I1R3_9SPHI|nr:hypothetical protein [Mucilaginibacter ginkgonis]QQL50909.1 hypothetical protein GO620_005485 [Mucilaginibacter ginkgonis]
MKIFPIALALIVTISACNNKPKPISKNVNKTVVIVNGKKDSVTNNPQKNYSNSTIPDVCTKTLLSIIQDTPNFKRLTTGKDAKNLVYVVNWVKAETPADRDNGSKITNGIELIVNEKTGGNKNKLGSYIYNNEDAKLYYDAGAKYQPLAGADTISTKRLRNGCYWGVASHK